MGRLRLLGPGLDHLSPSGTSTLQSCERQYVGRYGPEKIYDPPTEATATGSGFAWALETSSISAGITEYHACRPEGDPLFDDPEVRHRQGVIAEAIIVHAYDAYRLRFGHDEVVEREVTYLQRLDNNPESRLLQVRVDGVGNGYLVEDKLRSASSLRADAVENEVRQGRQLTAEIFAHWGATGEILPVQLRLLRKPDPRPLKKAPLEDIYDMVAAHFAEERAVQMYEVRRTPEQINLWLDEQRKLAARADALLSGRETPVRDTSACHMYGRTCPLLAQCQGMAA